MIGHSLASVIGYGWSWSLMVRQMVIGHPLRSKEQVSQQLRPSSKVHGGLFQRQFPAGYGSPNMRGAQGIPTMGVHIWNPQWGTNNVNNRETHRNTNLLRDIP